MVHTETAHFRFTVQEQGDGRPFLALEPAGASLSVLKAPARLLTLSLREGAGLDEAGEVARYLNENIQAVNLTTLE